ncbi:hypothetical protein EVAR_16021_1 [Eumeta japonica]|uniref:Uncharacterized protein n=1 Tax=Eumeta variegata TaxID=151549 RepID=A0A4C1W033_EUMVA|nr:hypothetical protein EVAR_16021_1 [Eumeta japonica]
MRAQSGGKPANVLQLRSSGSFRTLRRVTLKARAPDRGGGRPRPPANQNSKPRRAGSVSRITIKGRLRDRDTNSVVYKELYSGGAIGVIRALRLGSHLDTLNFRPFVPHN